MLFLFETAVEARARLLFFVISSYIYKPSIQMFVTMNFQGNFNSFTNFNNYDIQNAYYNLYNKSILVTGIVSNIDKACLAFYERRR